MSFTLSTLGLSSPLAPLCTAQPAPQPGSGPLPTCRSSSWSLGLLLTVTETVYATPLALVSLVPREWLPPFLASNSGLVIMPTLSLFPRSPGLFGPTVGLFLHEKPAGLPPEKGLCLWNQCMPDIWTKPFLWLSVEETGSPASSSNVRPLVSGNRKEAIVPHSMNSANICIRWSSHGEQVLPIQCGDAPLEKSGWAITCAMMAPTLPLAALRP